MADPKKPSMLAGVLERYQKEGPKAIRPHKDRFRKMLRARDPGVREVAAWALGRSGDLDAVPDLIAALSDADDRVVAAARQSLSIVSRKIEDPGPEPGATPEQKQAAIGAWRAWYESVRSLSSTPSESQAVPKAGGKP